MYVNFTIIFPLDCSSLVISDTDTGNEADEEEALHEKRKHQVLYITLLLLLGGSFDLIWGFIF